MYEYDLPKKLKTERKEAINIAKDFGYSEDVIYKLKKAKSITEIGNIMYSARNGERV